MVALVSGLLVYCAFSMVKEEDRGYGVTLAIRSCSIIMSLWVTLTYLTTALLDPGRYHPGLTPLTSTTTLRNCSSCKMKVPDNVRHCFTCDVCIIDMDHHCPWMSKCVGRGNLRSFWAFVGGMFVMMGLFWGVVFLVVMK